MTNTIPRKIIHIDMDCFYAAIEMRDNPELRGLPVAVGGDVHQRGVLCTCNYEARKFGVRSAMATGHALKLCPQLTIIKPNFQKYTQASTAILAIFAQFADVIEPISLDEAFLDVSNSHHFNNSATLLAQEIRRLIYREQQLTASAGIAENKFLAKIASEWHKPNGQFVIHPHDVSDFMISLPVAKIFGVGCVTRKKLADLGIQTCGQLQSVSLQQLLDYFGKFGQSLYHLCRGHDQRPVNNNRIRKSLSVEHTYNYDLSNLKQCQDKLEPLFDELQARLQKHPNKIINGLFIKLKFDTFQTTTVANTHKWVNLESYHSLLNKAYKRYQLPVRLIGVGVKFKHHANNKMTQLCFEF